MQELYNNCVVGLFVLWNYLLVGFSESLHVVRLPPSVNKTYLHGWLGFPVCEGGEVDQSAHILKNNCRTQACAPHCLQIYATQFALLLRQSQGKKSSNYVCNIVENWETGKGWRKMVCNLNLEKRGTMVNIRCIFFLSFPA